MPILLLLKNNWKAAIAIIATLATFWGGWHTHGIYTDYRAKKTLVADLNAARAAEVKIIRDTQTITRIVNHEVPTDCTHKPLPADIIKQLR